MSNFNLPNFVLVDFQYCHGNDNSIYIKEFAYMSGFSIVPNYCLFRSPFDSRELLKEGRRKNAYCKKYVHGLDWSDGSINYNCVGDILSPLNSYNYVLVIGQIKKEFLEKYLSTNIVNIEYKTSFRKMRNYFTNCPIHKDQKFKCAVNNLYKMFVFIESNAINSFDEIIYDEIKC